MTKCTTPWHASQPSATVGNSTSWPSSPNAVVMARKESPPIGTVRAMPCSTLPVTTPLRIATLFSAKVNAPSAAYRTPSKKFLPSKHLLSCPPVYIMPSSYRHVRATPSAPTSLTWCGCLSVLEEPNLSADSTRRYRIQLSACATMVEYDDRHRAAYRCSTPLAS